jgi:hypothetical protein
MISKQPTVRLVPARTLSTESPLRDLEAIIRSRTPLIAVESNEEPQIVGMVRQIGGRLQLKAYRWTVTEGLQAFEACDQPQQSVVKSQEILNYIKTSASHSLFVLLDFHPYLEDAVHVRYLKDIALTCSKHWSAVTAGSRADFPAGGFASASASANRASSRVGFMGLSFCIARQHFDRQTAGDVYPALSGSGSFVLSAWAARDGQDDLAGRCCRTRCGSTCSACTPCSR